MPARPDTLFGAAGNQRHGGPVSRPAQRAPAPFGGEDAIGRLCPPRGDGLLVAACAGGTSSAGPTAQLTPGASLRTPTPPTPQPTLVADDFTALVHAVAGSTSPADGDLDTRWRGVVRCGRDQGRGTVRTAHRGDRLPRRRRPRHRTWSRSVGIRSSSFRGEPRLEAVMPTRSNRRPGRARLVRGW